MFKWRYRMASLVPARIESWDGTRVFGDGVWTGWPMSTGIWGSFEYGWPSVPMPTNPAASFSVFLGILRIILPWTHGASSGPIGPVGDRRYAARNDPLSLV